MSTLQNSWFSSGLVVVCLVAWLFGDVVECQSAHQMCTYHGHVYSQGDNWADARTCDYCECNEYGVQCHAGLDGGPCKLQNMTVNAGDHLCVYNFRPHLVGDTFGTLDGCNKCSCTERGMQCTAHACKNTGFDTYSKTPLYGECHYDGHWYHFHGHWRALDGCNTCFCYSIGNYQGGYECTKTTCSNHVTG